MLHLSNCGEDGLNTADDYHVQSEAHRVYKVDRVGSNALNLVDDEQRDSELKTEC